MRCPACGASNPETAGWCGQCLAVFTPPAAGGSQPPTARPPADPHEVPGASGASAVQPAERADLTGGFRTHEGRIEWPCLACGSFNPIDVFACAVCGTPMADRFAPDTPERQVNWSAALALSALAAGAGHLAAGRYGTGSARMFLYVLWLLGGVVVAADGGRAWLAAAPLLLGATALWLGSLVDVTRLQRGQAELLGGRALLWLVVGVTGLLLLAGLGAFAGGGAPAPAP